MRIFLSKWLERFAQKEEIADSDLCDAVARAERGLIDADLGGGVIKQRIARTGQGRSGGFRSIVLYRRAERSFFVYGFAKNDKDNITSDELKEFRKLADLMLRYTDAELRNAVQNRVMREVMCNEQNV